jgi:hypothetical protein
MMAFLGGHLKITFHLEMLIDGAPPLLTLPVKGLWQSDKLAEIGIPLANDITKN